MSKKTYLHLFTSALIAFCAAGGLYPPATAQTDSRQTRQAPRQADAGQDAQAAQVLNDSVLVVRGMAFPRVAQPSAKLAGAAGVQSCCTIGDTRSVNGVASIDITSPNNMKKDKTYPADGPIQAVYSPPLSCWVISGYSRHVSSANSPYFAYDDAQPANFNYLTSSQYEAVYEELKSYVFTMNILDKYKAELNLKLEEFVKNYGMYANSISTSHGQARHTAHLGGRGFPNGRSWYKGYLNVTETCCPPEVRDAAQLKATLKSWVDQTASKLPRNPVGPRDFKNSTLRQGVNLSPGPGELAPAPTPTPGR